MCAELGYPLVLGRIKNKVNIKKSIEALVYACLDIPLVGIDKRSHEWESIAIYDPKINLNLLKSLVQYFIAKQKIDISTAIF